MQHTHSGHGVWLSRSARALLAVACAVCTFLATGNAWASAPMCNELAQTIEAPPPAMKHDGGTIAAADDCAPDHFAKSPPGAPHRANTIDFGYTLKLAPTTGISVSPRLRPPRQRVTSECTPCHPGFSTGIYRPPR